MHWHVEHLVWGFLQINHRDLLSVTKGKVFFHHGGEFWELLP
jgi:hypothetical protein